MGFVGRVLQCWGSWISTWGSLLTSGTIGTVHHCTGLEEEQCKQSVAVSPTLLMQSFLVSVVPGILTSPPVLGLSQWCLIYG